MGYDRDQFVSEFPDLGRYLRRVAAAHEGIADYVRTQQEPTTWFPAPIGPRFKHRLITPEELEGIVELPGSFTCSEHDSPLLPWHEALLPKFSGATRGAAHQTSSGTSATSRYPHDEIINIAH